MGNLSDIGERLALRSLAWPRIWSEDSPFRGDDAAVIGLNNNTSLLISTDAGPRQTFMDLLRIGSPEDRGHYFATMSLSDIAAMGCQPNALVAAFLLPSYTDHLYFASLIDGIIDACNNAGAKYVGGDTKESDSIRIITSAIGYAKNRDIIGRQGAKAGDILCISGPLGKTLSSYIKASSVSSSQSAQPLHRPEARVKFSRSISRRKLATSCIDMSDGPIAAARELCDANNAYITIDISEIDHHQFIPQNLSRSVWSDIVMGTGGDFELMFTANPKKRSSIEDLGGIVCGEVIDVNDKSKLNVIGYNDLKSQPWESFTSSQTWATLLSSITPSHP